MSICKMASKESHTPCEEKNIRNNSCLIMTSREIEFIFFKKYLLLRVGETLYVEF